MTPDQGAYSPQTLVDALRHGDLTINPAAREVALAGRRLGLTRAQLVQLAWGCQDEGGTRLLDNHICNLARNSTVSSPPDRHRARRRLQVRPAGELNFTLLGGGGGGNGLSPRDRLPLVYR